MTNGPDFEDKLDDQPLHDAGRSSNFPGAAGAAKGRINRRINIAPLGNSPAGRIMLANDLLCYVPVVEAELRPDGTAEVVRYETNSEDVVWNVVDYSRCHPGWFMLTDDEGLRLRGKALATKLVIFLPDPVVPEREQAFVYRVSNPAPLCAYRGFRPPLNLEPPLLRLTEYEAGIRRTFERCYGGKPVSYIQEYISDFEDTEDLNAREEILHEILDQVIVLYDMTVALMPDVPGALPLLADLFPYVGE